MDRRVLRGMGVALCLLCVVMTRGVDAVDHGAAADFEDVESVPALIGEQSISMDLVDLVVVVDNSSNMTTAISCMQAELYSQLVAPLVADIGIYLLALSSTHFGSSSCFQAISLLPNRRPC